MDRLGRLRRYAGLGAACFAAVLVLGLAAGCSQGAGANKAATAPQEKGQSMAGPAVQIHIPVSVVANKPKPWDLSTPESAVRSYLDWRNYAYRIATSDAATPTMSDKEEVRVDSYVQYNIEKKRLLDAEVTSLTFGPLSRGSTSTVVPATEQWSYSYRSVEQGNQLLGGPYSVTYKSTYKVIKNLRGQWIVDSQSTTATAGTVK